MQAASLAGETHQSSVVTLRARTWFGQFREIVLKAAVRNIELAPYVRSVQRADNQIASASSTVRYHCQYPADGLRECFDTGGQIP